MNPKLLALLITVGAAGGVAIFVPRALNPSTGQPVTIAELRDAGFTNDCNARVLSCAVRLSPLGIAQLNDAGVSTDAGTRYRRVAFPVGQCADGGLVLARGVARGLDREDVRIYRPEDCQLKACAAFPGLCQRLGDPSAYAPDTLGCRRRPAGAAVASCRRRLSDGGVRDFGDLNVMPSAEAVGTGCEEAPCAVVAGEVP